MDMLKSWCGNRMAFSWGRPGPDEQAEIAANMVRYWRYCEDFVARRARDPRDDFTSDLIGVHLARSCCCSGRPAGIRDGSVNPRRSTSTAAMRVPIWPSEKASTIASARRWPGWKPGSCSSS
jgi:hypothetical protein